MILLLSDRYPHYVPYSATRADENTATGGTAIQMPEAMHTYICDDCEFMTTDKRESTRHRKEVHGDVRQGANRW